MIKNIRALLLIASSCILSSSVFAVSDNSDVEMLFTANVRILDINLLPDTNSIQYDNSDRVLRSADRVYPYPDSIQSIYQIFDEESELLILGVVESLPDTAETTNRSTSWIWMFDRQTGTFMRNTPLCGNPIKLGPEYIDSQWVYVTTPITGQVYLCETMTGNISESLPANFTWVVQPPFSTLTLPVFTSPDGKWLLLFGETNDHIYIFSYDISSQALTEQGQIPCNFCVERNAVRWFDTTAMVSTWTSASEHIIYSVDVTQANSLQQRVMRPQYLPEFYEDPPRYDYVNFTTPLNIWETQCQHVIYDIVLAHIQIIEMGPLCRPEYGSLSGIGYYRDVTNGAEGIAALTRFNGETRESEVLYENEIERIEWVSANEDYAIVILDSNGRIDTVPFLDPLSWSTPEQPKLAYTGLSLERQK